MKLKKLTGFLFCTVIFLFPQNSVAAPAYGPKLPQQNQFHIGGQTYLVFKRNLDQERGSMSSSQHLFLISYGIFDWLSLDMKGGAGDIHQDPEQGAELSYPAFVGGGYGFRIKLYDSDATDFIVGFQHISIHPYSITINGVKHKSVLDDWQFSFLLSHQIKNVTPYIGGKWSRMDYINWQDNERERVKSDLGRTAGALAGINIPLTEKTWLNLEGQFVDVNALAASFNFSF